MEAFREDLGDPGEHFGGILAPLGSSRKKFGQDKQHNKDEKIARLLRHTFVKGTPALPRFAPRSVTIISWPLAAWCLGGIREAYTMRGGPLPAW